jgi:hypothetical protein
MAAFVLDASVAISWCFPDLALRTGLALATSDETLRRAAIAQGIAVLA